MSGTGDAEIDRRLGEATGQIERLAEIAPQLAELRGEGFAVDGLVRVEVGSGGHLMGLDLDARALRLNAAALANAIMEASRQATKHLADKARELTGPLEGGQLDIGAALTGTVPGSPTSQQLLDDVAAVSRAETPSEVIRLLRAQQGG